MHMKFCAIEGGVFSYFSENNTVPHFMECFTFTGHPTIEVIKMARGKKDPSTAGVSAASVKGTAGPTVENSGGGKRNSQNNQFKKRH